MAAKRVAIIDDSEIILEAASEALTEAGFDAVTMTEPIRELLLGDDGPDLVLVDVNMPLAYGDEIAQFLKDGWKIPAKVYLYSTLAAMELACRAAAAGADGYICKDWGLERLVSCVEDILGQQEEPTRELAAIEPIEELDRAQSQSIFHRFTEQCRQRRERISRLLSKRGDGKLLRRIDLELHDWVGEAKMIGLDKVAGVAETIKRVIHSWRPAIKHSTQGPQLTMWIDQLTEISIAEAQRAPDEKVTAMLQQLRTETKEELEVAAKQKNPTGELSAVAMRRILVFDDSPIIREALALELESRHHVVALAADVDEFNKQLADFSPEIIFLDINMPDVKGDVVCRRLRDDVETSNIPIIFLSSLPDEELSALAERAGANGYLSKLRGMDELVEYLDDTLEQILF